jgi:dipeptidyl aminopeptidase/acylaminoacyl peptidase
MLVTSAAAVALELPPTIDSLRQSQQPAASLELVRNLEPGPGFQARLFSYRSAGLKVYAYVAVPTSQMPSSGYPVLVANHGTHPNPPRYGFTTDGADRRPGDYYRSIPALYAARGFMVVMPDYRGHNASEGGEYAHGFLASNYYAEDVLSLLAALPSLPQADQRNLFMWGHSLGGEVTLKALLATDKIRAASLWSTVGGDVWEQAYYYSAPGSDREPYDSSETPKSAVLGLRHDLELFAGKWDYRESEALPKLDRLRAPVILHHSRADEGALFAWSSRIAQELYRLGKPYVFYAYPGAAHFLEGDDRVRAVERDAAFFDSLMQSAP